MITYPNALKGSYKSYFLHNIKQLVEEIPIERRQVFAEELKLKSNLLGCKDKDVLQVVLEHLARGAE